MKILMLCPTYSIHSVKWLNAMAERGFEVHACCCAGQEDKANLLKNEIIVHTMPFKAPLGYYLNILSIRHIVKAVNPDLIHVHRASSYGTLARLSEIHCDVLSIWGSDVYEFPYKSSINMRTLEKNLLYARALASTSAVMANQTKQFLAGDTKTIHVTPFGVDVKSFAPRKPIEKDSITIGTVKTLSVKYGIDDGIRAYAKALQMLIENGHEEIALKTRYLIYGRGPLREEMQELISELQLQERVKLMGYVQNNKVPDILNSFDIFLVCSREESFGVAAVEAMSCGLPVIATKAPGFSEVVDDRQTGLLSEIGDIDDIAKNLYELIINPERREVIGSQGRIKVLQHYDWDKNVNQMIDIYNGVT